MSKNGHQSNSLKHNRELACTQCEAGQTVNPNSSAKRKGHLKKAGPAVAVGFATGLAEASGLHITDIAGLIANHPWPSSGIGLAAIASLVGVRLARTKLVTALKWFSSLVRARFLNVAAYGYLAVALMSLTGCAQTPLAERFRAVQPGLTEAATVALMGIPPRSRSVSKYVDEIVLVTLKWVDHGHDTRIFIVRLVGARRFGEPRVVSTRACEGTMHC